MDVASTDQFLVHPSVICRELSGETVLLNLESGVYYGLDAVGTRVWQLMHSSSICCFSSVNRFNAIHSPGVVLQSDRMKRTLFLIMLHEK